MFSGASTTNRQHFMTMLEKRFRGSLSIHNGGGVVDKSACADKCFGIHLLAIKKVNRERPLEVAEVEVMCKCIK